MLIVTKPEDVPAWVETTWSYNTLAADGSGILEDEEIFDHPSSQGTSAPSRASTQSEPSGS